jgi:hypothetical protein
MKVFDGEYECISWLQTQDLKANGIGLGVQGKKLKDGYLCGPWYVTGYLYDKETLHFPVGERFKINIDWINKEDAEKQIERIREACQ